jgi:hypothetical protein
MTPPVGLAEIVKTFGRLEDPSFERDNIVSFELPYHLIYGTALVRSTRAHRLVAPVFVEVFKDIKCQGLIERATHFGGIYARRNIRGATHPSCHSWGIAIDLNPEENPLGKPGRMDPRVVAVFKKHGFTWGGEFHTRLDPMHFQYASGY